MIAGLAALAGAVVGALLPRLIALIPDRAPGGIAPDVPAGPTAARADAGPAGEPADPAAESEPAGSSEPAARASARYGDLAAAPHLSWYLGAATAALWALFAATGWDASLPAVLLVAGLGVMMGYIDVREHRLPDWLTYPALVGAAVALAGAAWATGEWSSYGRAWLAAAVLTTAFLLLALIRPGELGLGDVKLVASLGLLLGWIGWGHVVLGAFLAFAFGGIYSAALLVLRRAGRRSAIPFGPFLLAGAFATIAWGEAMLDAYLG